MESKTDKRDNGEVQGKDKLWLTRSIYVHDNSSKYFKVLTYKKRRDTTEREESVVGEITECTKEEAVGETRMYLCSGALPIIPIDDTRCGIDHKTGKLVFLNTIQRSRLLQASQMKETGKKVRFAVVESTSAPSLTDVNALKLRFENNFSAFTDAEPLPRVRQIRSNVIPSMLGESKSDNKKIINKNLVDGSINNKKEIKNVAEVTVPVLLTITNLIDRMTLILKSDMTSVNRDVTKQHPDFTNCTGNDALNQIIAPKREYFLTKTFIEKLVFEKMIVGKDTTVLLLNKGTIEEVVCTSRGTRLLYNEELELAIACPYRTESS